MFLKPVRKIRQSDCSITGKRPSLKTNASQHFESTLERDHVILLEFDDDIENYVVQPVTIHYEHNNRSTRYTPDVAVYYKSALQRKPVLIEIKYHAELIEKKDELERKFNAAKEYASNNGFEFKVVTEKEIRTDYLYNIKFLSRYSNSVTDQNLVQLVCARFANTTLTAQQLICNDDEESKARVLHALWQLVADKTLECDMNQRITMTTITWKKDRS